MRILFADGSPAGCGHTAFRRRLRQQLPGGGSDAAMGKADTIVIGLPP